jgi:hypothetical protein
MKKVDNRNLHESSAQEVFDYVANHLITQNDQSRAIGGACRYKSHCGKKTCSGGCLIHPDDYKATFEGLEWGRVSEILEEETHQELIISLQDLHDQEPVEDWKDELINLARRENLTVNFS